MKKLLRCYLLNFNIVRFLMSALFVFCMLLYTQAQHVSIERARTVAKNLYIEQFSSMQKSLDNVGILSEKTMYRYEEPTVYIFNMDVGGFVLTSSDERIRPVLAFASAGVFDTQSISCCASWMLEQYSKQIHEVIVEGYDNSVYLAHEDWSKYDAANFQKSTQLMSNVSPLVTTTWSQGCYYNAMCPADSSLGTTRCGRVPVGCVATAFAQVLKYYSFPAQGVGTKSYNHSRYGTLTANFAATTYNYAAMPNKLTSDNQAAATLLYHTGVSINMDYGPSGSSAYTTDVRKALVNTFKYASSTQYVYKTSYNDAQWVNMVKAELNAQRIVIISGYDPDAKAGHAFICDGYQNNDHFHVNWGWNGSADGYFYLNALSPSSYAFNSNVGAIRGITPSVTPTACSGTQTLTAASGVISDGSGTANYTDNLDCKWLLKPTNAGTITLTFSAFDTENNYDFVKVYDGETTSAPLLGSYSGTSIPPVLTSSSNKMLVHFTTDGSQTRNGWTANYVGNPITSFCNGMTTLTAKNGTFSDGSGSADYKNNTDCKWLISPPDSSVIKLSFTSFKTEANYDFVKVYDGATTSSPLLGSFSGSSIPQELTGTAGKMLVHFTSDNIQTRDGWSAKYTTQSSFCSGTTTRTAASGTISDGSGNLNYNDNADCKWLIKPNNASSVTLTFTSFSTEANYDFVKIYNGTTTSAPLLGSFSGNTLPPTLTANSGKMLVHFTSDYIINAGGWSANYTKNSKESTDMEEKELADRFIIVPNPNDGHFSLYLPSDINCKSICIYDMLGKIVYTSEINTADDVVNLSLNVADGVYYIIIDTDEARINKKIIVNAKNK